MTVICVLNVIIKMSAEWVYYFPLWVFFFFSFLVSMCIYVCIWVSVVSVNICVWVHEPMYVDARYLVSGSIPLIPLRQHFSLTWSYARIQQGSGILLCSIPTALELQKLLATPYFLCACLGIWAQELMLTGGVPSSILHVCFKTM